MRMNPVPYRSILWRNGRIISIWCLPSLRGYEAEKTVCRCKLLIWFLSAITVFLQIYFWLKLFWTEKPLLFSIKKENALYVNMTSRGTSCRQDFLPFHRCCLACNLYFILETCFEYISLLKQIVYTVQSVRKMSKEKFVKKLN